MKPASKAKDSKSELELDEEDAKIVAETKAKGYCYFRNSSDDAALIGDIRPTSITYSTSLDSAAAAAINNNNNNSSSSSGLSASSWNMAGTWEEKNTTTLVKDRLKA